MRRGVTGDRGINEGRPGGEARLCRESALTLAGGCQVDSTPPEGARRRGRLPYELSRERQARRPHASNRAFNLRIFASITLVFASNRR